MLAGPDSIGKSIMYFGVILLVAGALIHFGGKLFNLGRLPGDIQIQKDNLTVYFPIVSSILLSIILTVILNLFFRR